MVEDCVKFGVVFVQLSSRLVLQGLWAGSCCMGRLSQLETHCDFCDESAYLSEDSIIPTKNSLADLQPVVKGNSEVSE